MFSHSFKGKRVLVTGHTGFKGSWLSLWLKNLGAHVAGVSKEIPTTPSHFELLNLHQFIDADFRADIRDYEAIQKVFSEFNPEIVFHLAAEPIVSTCIQYPKLAFDTNLGGFVNVMECLRRSKTVKAAVLITSDKCYENVEWDYGYREIDRLGGKDPYSASKACAEIAFSSYFRSYFCHQDIKIATARAGNVIGGGDWAKDRIIADCVKAIKNKSILEIRSPNATRPWQLVLEPLSGYLQLASQLLNNPEATNGQAFNFGPPSEVEVTVAELLQAMKDKWSEVSWTTNTAHKIVGKEAGLLKLNCDKALRQIAWKPTLHFDETVQFLTDWYQAWTKNEITSKDLSLKQIELYTQLAQERQIEWALS